jgi:hypothetical protein
VAERQRAELQNHLDPRSPSFVVELPAGPVGTTRAAELAQAVRAAAR